MGPVGIAAQVDLMLRSLRKGEPGEAALQAFLAALPYGLGKLLKFGGKVVGKLGIIGPAVDQVASAGGKLAKAEKALEAARKAGGKAKDLEKAILDVEKARREFKEVAAKLKHDLDALKKAHPEEAKAIKEAEEALEEVEKKVFPRRTPESFRAEAEAILKRAQEKYGTNPNLRNMAKKPDIRFIDYLQQKYKLTDAQREILHEAITGQGLPKHEIEDLAKFVKDNYPNVK